MKEELLKGLSEEQIAKLKACNNNSIEILKLAKEEGIELTEDQLAAVSGGGCFSPDTCDECGSENDYTKTYKPGNNEMCRYEYRCNKCGNVWYVAN